MKILIGSVNAAGSLAIFIRKSLFTLGLIVSFFMMKSKLGTAWGNSDYTTVSVTALLMALFIFCIWLMWKRPQSET